MIEEEDFIKLWQSVKNDLPVDIESETIPVFAIEVLRKWGWPYKPIPLQEQYPPLNQSFLGFYPETGWLLDYWKEGYIPYPEDMPTHWLSLNVLPTPVNA